MGKASPGNLETKGSANNRRSQQYGGDDATGAKNL